jgi:hypothetical protein
MVHPNQATSHRVGHLQHRANRSLHGVWWPAGPALAFPMSKPWTYSRDTSPVR